jgi:hypothetical protein
MFCKSLPGAMRDRTELRRRRRFFARKPGPLSVDPALVAEVPPRSWNEDLRRRGRRLQSLNEARIELVPEEANQPRQSTDFDEEFPGADSTAGGRRQNIYVGRRRGLTSIARHRGHRRRVRRNIDDADVDPIDTVERRPARSLMCFRWR